MGRIKGKYIAQVIINVDMEYTDTDLPIAKVKERFARMMTPMVQEALQELKYRCWKRKLTKKEWRLLKVRIKNNARTDDDI